ncbi:hypothetical protein PF002_g29717 [Phytophthora fragariae]|uniref:Resolvase HTH domain-containing protein n=1 Tax=Phytophthora fragariae TaxID=53985 RepID=A0A6A3QCY1_9STRA|nr:hypothetical protein PF009_g26335 [Phytophthora fragariae]KAE9073551.1 hypothetical protein PF006_g28712 [Phytophthora fragariae]KAE9171852.1 hypothetical protein PF002_g29717 [Phytophthora fragariae]
MAQRTEPPTQADIEEAYSLLQTPMTKSAIARRMGLSKYQVYRAIKKHRL